MKSLNLEDITTGSINQKKISLKDIAIVGISVNLPGAKNLNELWNVLTSGAEQIGELPESRQYDVNQYMNYMAEEKELNQCGYLNDIDKFDYKFFRLSYREACSMDPRHRLFLQSAWEAIEDGGYSSESIQGTKTGIYVGLSDLGDYTYIDMFKNTSPNAIINAVSGNTASLLPSRLSYLLDLKGPSMVIDTSCSSSMTALAQACQSVRSGNIDMALVSGVRIYPYPVDNGIKLGIESSDGKTRTFDSKADGTGTAEAVISILIKPLVNAEKDNDHIYGVIKGFALNQDGNSLGLTSPNGDSQIKVLEEAWNDAGINPQELSYIEAHGTATKLGDPIEVEAISKAISKYTDLRQYCGIGSIKSNIGHSYDASGLVSLAKVLLILKHKHIPPTINFKTLNSQINLDNSPVYISDSNRDIDGSQDEILCGISSFGFSGTNGHMVLRSYQKTPNKKSSKRNIVALSSKSLNSLHSLLRNLYRYIWTTEEIRIDDICYTYANRDTYDYRIAFEVSDWNEFKELVKNATCKFEKLSCMEKVYLSSNISGQKRSISHGDDMYENTCIKYINGDPIALRALYKERECKTVSVPTYAFEEIRCWLTVPDGVIAYQVEQTNETKPQERTVKLISDDDYKFSDIEKTVADIWGKSLGCQSININDNYFDLGGDSILAIQICNMVDKRFNLSTNVSEIMRHPCLKEYSAYISLLVNNFETVLPSETSIIKTERNTMNLTSSVQKRMYITQSMYPSSIFNNISRVWIIHGQLQVERFVEAIKYVVDRHEVLRSSYHVENGELYQKISEVELPVKYIENPQDDFNEIIIDYIKPFELNCAPLFRIVIAKYSDCYKVLFDFHHIITDGTSNGVIASEIIRRYESKELLPLDLQYIDYASWQNKNRNSVTIQNQESYWVEVFKEKPPRIKYENKDFTGSQIMANEYVTILSKEQTNQLNKFASINRVSVFSSILSTLFVALAAYNDESDIVVGIPTSGRHYQGISESVGAFINTLAIRSYVTTQDSLLTFIRTIYKITLEAFDNQDYQYDDLIKRLHQEGYSTNESLFDVMFMYHNMPMPNIVADEIHIENYNIFNGESQFPLTLEATPLDNKIELKFIYQMSSFSNESIAQLAKNIKSLIENINTIYAKQIEDIDCIVKNQKKIRYQNSIDTDFSL